jgi:hypothetical protein
MYPTFLDLVRHQKGFPGSSACEHPDVQTSRQEADAVAILGTPLCPSGGRQSAWYRLRHSLGARTR